VIPNVALKLNKRCVLPTSLPKLKELSQFVDEIANVRHNPRLPWVGSAAFSHKGGQHVNAVQKVSRSYEHIDPALVGNTRTVLISDLAGKSNIVLKAQELGFKITNDTPELKTILTRIKELEHQGYEFEAAEGSLALLIGKLLKHQKAPFIVVAYHVSMRRDGWNRSWKPPSKCAWRPGRTHGSRRRRPGKRARFRLARRAGAVLSANQKCPAHRLQGAYPGFYNRHRCQNPRAHPIHRWKRGMGTWVWTTTSSKPASRRSWTAWNTG